MTAKPITPDECPGRKAVMIPDTVIEVFNNLIAKHFHNGHAVVRQNEAVLDCESKGLDKHEIFENHWFDIETLYREYGWDVRYESPGYNESGSTYFEFTVKK